MPAEKTGCVLCGHDIAYDSQPTLRTCVICGAAKMTDSCCEEGHYVCDECHRGDILAIAGRLLSNSEEKDPVRLAISVFELPGLKMHGPEYHSLVPAILVAAYQNFKGYRDENEILEAIRRGKDFRGGSCGLAGTCGACAGAGIAASVVRKATPLAGAARSVANRVTGTALLDMSDHGGARCCKREAITAIRAYMAVTGDFGDMEPTAYHCRQSLDNKDCIGIRCPYFAVRH